MASTYIIKIICADEKGLVHKITGVLFQNEFNVERTDEFVQPESNTFYMRVVFEGEPNEKALQQQLLAQLPANAQVFIEKKRNKNVVLMVTKEHHALSDLLIRNQFKDLNINILAVIGNNNILADLVQKFNIPFHYLPAAGTDDASRQLHEAEIIKCLANYDFDYLILAKFMRVLTPAFTKLFSGKTINIHHSFLPAFIGANPYRQAYDRGVKIIGATAHFVTDDLDEGPIIYQDVINVNHAQNPQELSAAGKDVEKIVLATALKMVMEDRVFISGNKTIIF